MQQFTSHQDGHEVHFSRNSPHKDLFLYIHIYIYYEYESIHKDVN